MSSGNITSVASNTSAGAAGGSVIDVNGLVSQLVAATKAPQESLITAQTTAVTTQISAVGKLKSALSTFQSSLSALATPGAFGAEAASSSNPNAFTATATSSAVGGSYSISVSQLAQAQQLASAAFAGGSSATVGTGTLQLTLGSSSFKVTIDSTNDTVAGIAAAINSASGNPGVTATVLTGSDGAHLVLSSTLSGAANTISVSETDGGGGLSTLTYGTGNTSNYTQQSAPQDARFSIAGVSYTSASNTVSNALSGVTLNLTGTTTTNAMLTVSSDTSTIQSNITNFVKAYNTLVSSLSSLGSYDSTTGSAGPMLGDALLSGIQNQVRSALYQVVNTGSDYSSLASIGITTNSDGTLSVNNFKLATALTSGFSAVSEIFSGKKGVASTLNTQVTQLLAKNGPIDSRSQTLIKQDNDLTKKEQDLTKHMNDLTHSLTQQYSALNTLLSSLQTTSSYLTQAFAALPTVQNKG